MLDQPHMDHSAPKIQVRPIPSRSKGRKTQKSRKTQGGYYLPALQAITAARGFIAGTFPTLNIAALSCGSHRGSVAAAVVVLKTENLSLLVAVLGGRKPLLATARSARHATTLIDSFRRASGLELQIFGRVITPEKIFTEVVVPAL